VRWLLLFAALCLGCAGAKPPAAPADQKSASATAGWTRWELPLEGISADFPAKPEQFETSKDSEQGAMTTSTLAASHADHIFGVSYTTRQGRDRPSDQDWIEGVRKSSSNVERFEPFELGDFRGILMWRNEEGKRTANWYLLVGDGFISAVVSAASNKFDEPAARRFFQSVRFELPWRIYSAPIGRLSVAVPAAAVEVAAADLDYAAEGPSRAFFVGGKHDLAFVIGTVEIDAAMEKEKDDDLLARGAAALAAQGANVSWQSPIQFEGARGLDYLAEFNGLHIRGRLLRVDHYMYSLEVRARARAVVTGAHHKRFMESLRWY